MKIIFYPFAAIGSLLTALLSILLFNWWVVLFVDENGNLPRRLSYFQTFDAPIPKGWKNGVAWLNRNPAYGFDYYVWGIDWNPDDWTVKRFYSDEITTIFFATGDGAFNFYYSTTWGQVKFGWKAWNNFTDGKFNSNFGDGKRIPICLTIKGKSSS